MYVRERVLTTVAIWFAITSIALTVMLTNNFLDGGAVVSLMAVLGITAAASTRFVWNGTLGAGALSREQIQIEAEKSKRGTGRRMNRFLAGLSDDEIADLRERLMGQEDGELVTLNDLMTEGDRRSRYSR